MKTLSATFAFSITSPLNPGGGSLVRDYLIPVKDAQAFLTCGSKAPDHRHPRLSHGISLEPAGLDHL